MSRIRADYVFGTTTAALTSTDTTLSSAALSRLPAVVAPDVAAVTLHDPATGAYEIVHVTAHTASANTATIARGREGSTAQAWAAGATWDHGLTSTDIDDLADSINASGGGLFRGEWTTELLMWSWDFTATPLDPGFSEAVTGAGVLGVEATLAGTTNLGNPPAGGYTKGEKLNTGNANSGSSSKLTLNIGALGITGVTKIKAYRGIESSNWNYNYSEVRKNGVAVASSSARYFWVEDSITCDSDDVIEWYHRGNNGSGTESPNGSMYVTGIRIYGTPSPYMLGEYVAYNGQLWRSDADNNSGTPGTSGWTKVPLASLATGAAPANTTTPVAWATVTIGSSSYRVPLYQ